MAGFAGDGPRLDSLPEETVDKEAISRWLPVASLPACSLPTVAVVQPMVGPELAVRIVVLARSFGRLAARFPARPAGFS